MEERLDGGKISAAEFDLEMSKTFDRTNQPGRVRLVPRFHACFKALKIFFSTENPPIVTHRSANFQLIAYGFVDASKGGFGASVDYQSHSKFRIGVWGKDTESDSSNYRDFCNIVETVVKEEEKMGNLKNVTLILATDNSTVEAAGKLHQPEAF